MYLNTHSCFSLRYGTIKLKELLSMAQQKGVKQFALTDINMTSACLGFVRMSIKNGIKPILGVDFRNGAQQKFIMIARSNHGFQHINTYLTTLLHKKEWEVPHIAEQLEDTFVVYPYRGHLDHLALQENEYLGVSIKDLNHLRYSSWFHRQDKLVILHTVSFQHKSGFNTHRLLRAIDNNTLLSKLSKDEQAQEWHQMLDEEELLDYFRDFPQIIKNTKFLLNSSSTTFDLDNQNPKNQKSYTDNEDLDFRLLRKLSYDGLAYRYPSSSKKVFLRIEQELDIISKKRFVSYFLINWKILKYARDQGYYYVGRGSGANSIIAYLLRITDVDPVELDLYFERFINLYRKNPPDFDIDFSWADRDDIIQFIFRQFRHTALVTVYNTFKSKASVRELGKVFGLPKHEIDLLASENFDYRQLDQLSKLVILYSQKIVGLPNYLGIHAGGILISEKPIQAYCATFFPPKGFSTAHIDMEVAEDIGLYKFDILSQRGLGKIKDSISIIKENTGNDVDIHDFQRFKKDERVKHLLRNAKAIGCFYVESPAMRMLLKKLQVDHYLGLVAASSIIRPGVAKSGMMKEYILRFRNPERRKEAHPILLEIMPETYGVMVYQEDVIKVAHFFAGLTLGEADMLRRGMSGKFRSRDEFMKVQQKFFDNCKEKGYPYDLVADIWRQTESFAGYAFAKGHSASYAVESYQSLFLKAYYPLEYMVATINNGGGFYRPELYVHEARMHGGIIEAPCINNSNGLTVIKGGVIYLGLGMLHELENRIIKEIMRVRDREGQFVALAHFVGKVQISLDQLILLIRIGAFRFTNRSKKQLLWDAYMLLGHTKKSKPVYELFKVETKTYSLPVLYHNELEDAFDEMELLGFPLTSPFFLLKNGITINTVMCDMKQSLEKAVGILGYLITVKRTRTSGGKEMNFGTFVDLDGHFIDTTHFPPVCARFPFRGKGVYKIIGKVVEEFDFLSIEVTSMYKEPYVDDPRYFEHSIEKIGFEKKPPNPMTITENPL